MAAPSNLRLRLRADTAPVHARLDALAAPLDLAKADDLARFLRAHHRASLELAGRNQELASMLSARAELAAADLRALGAGVTTQTSEAGDAIGSTGLLYVIAGSHLGARQLAARVRTSGDARLHAATSLLDDASLAPRWKALVQTLRDARPGGAVADAAVRDAAQTFAVFERAFSAFAD